MSLDQDSMDEQSNEPAELTRTQLSEKEIHSKAKIALEKERMGLPLSDADRISLKFSKVVDDIRQEKS